MRPQLQNLESGELDVAPGSWDVCERNRVTSLFPSPCGECKRETEV